MYLNQPGILSIDGQLLAVRPLTMESECGQPTRIELEIVPHVFDRSNRSNAIARLVSKPSIKRVIFNVPATIVLWSDGSKTVVKCQDGDDYSAEMGLAMCIAKKYFGNQGKYNEVFKKWIPEFSDISVEDMREKLEDYCSPRLCSNCVLGDKPFRCGRGTYFCNTNKDGSYDMTDDEIRKAYRVVFGK